MNYKHIKQLSLLGALVVAAIVSHYSGAFNPFWLQVSLFIGINITLAASLNLINGYTGQFSLGHAGFMALGAYASAYLSTEKSAAVFHLFGGPNAVSIAVVFASVLLAGGIAAAVAGLIVGVPSLRL